jgi:N-acetylgalactosamine-N,N'-diacetylbacillosaminyl-diphospho-undecaprenol 4-alpha-N-acetylgalactosaminyltransferase
MSKKVFILVNAFEAGGAERMISLLLFNLGNQYDITMVLLHHHIDYDLPSNQKIISLNQPHTENGILTTLKLPLLAWRYKKLCKKNKVEVSMSFLKRPNYINCLSRIIGNKTKIIISERTYLSEYKNMLPLLIKMITTYLTKWLYPSADLIVPNAQLIKLDLENNFNIHAKYRVINNPVNFDMIYKLSNIQTDLPFDSTFTFISVGNFKKEKKHEVLIDAFNIIKHLNIKLILLGKGILEDKIKEKVTALNLQSQVIFAGFDNNPFKYLSKSNCFVMASAFEGFPNALIEAMGCGVPVISTDCLSGPREIIAPESNQLIQITDHIEIAEYGILVPVNSARYLAKAMKKVVKDKKLCQVLKMKSKKRAEDFEVSKIMKEFDEVLNM